MATGKAPIQCVWRSKTCRRIGIKCLTLYAFSVENWLRPEAEVRALLKLLQEYLEKEVQGLMDQDIRLVAIGNLDSLGEPIVVKLKEAMARTADESGNGP